MGDASPVVLVVDDETDLADSYASLLGDDYVTKPVTRDELEATVEGLLRRSSYRDEVRRYFSLVTKRAALETEKTEAELADSDSYAELVDEIGALEAALDDLVDDLTMDDYVAMLRDLERESGADG